MDLDHLPAGHRPIDDLTDRPPSHQAFAQFMRAMQLHRQLLTRQMNESGIHPSQAFALREIGHNDGITQRDLAEKLNISRPTLTVMLQKMERARLVERRADAKDQRFTRLHLTQAGHDAHEAMHGALGRIISESFGPLEDDDLNVLARLLGMLNDNLAGALGADSSCPAHSTRPTSATRTER